MLVSKRKVTPRSATCAASRVGEHLAVAGLVAGQPEAADELALGRARPGSAAMQPAGSSTSNGTPNCFSTSMSPPMPSSCFCVAEQLQRALGCARHR